MFILQFLIIFLSSILLNFSNAQRTPVINFITQKQIKDIGETVELECSVQYQREFTVVWMKKEDNNIDNILISSGSSLDIDDLRFSILFDRPSSTYVLTISDIQENDAGIYQCEILFPKSKITAEVELSINNSSNISDNTTHLIVYSMGARCDKYFCTANVYTCILKGFGSVEEIEDFCSKRSVFEYTDINGNINTTSNLQCHIIEFQNISMTCLPSACFTKFTSINELYANNTGIELIEDDDFQNLRSLQILNLSGNKIDKFKNLWFQYSGNLREIDFSHNQIEDLDLNISNVSVWNNLMKIDFSYNKIKKFNEQILQKYFKTTQYSNRKVSILLNNNQIEKFISTMRNCEILYDQQSTLELNLTYNSLKSIESKCDITVLDISNNQLEDVKANATEVIADNNKIKTMNFFTDPNIVSLKNNDLKSLDYVNFLSTFKNVQELDISNNSFGTLKKETFADMRNLKKLSLRGIGLTRTLFGLFGHLRKLEYLDLSYNDLSTFDHRHFLALDNLKILELSGNKLRGDDMFYINFRNVLPNLQFIALEGNELWCDHLSKIKKNLNAQQIELIEAKYPVKYESNIYGIQCFYDG